MIGITLRPSNVNSVERATINADGSLGAFSIVPDVALVTARGDHTTVVIGDWLYVLGGRMGGGSLTPVGALVRIERRPAPATTADPDALFALVRAGFGQRRKMLRRSLAALVDGDAFERAGISAEARAEELSVEDWGRLAR